MGHLDSAKWRGRFTWLRNCSVNKRQVVAGLRPSHFPPTAGLPERCRAVPRARRPAVRLCVQVRRPAHNRAFREAADAGSVRHDSSAAKHSGKRSCRRRARRRHGDLGKIGSRRPPRGPDFRHAPTRPRSRSIDQHDAPCRDDDDRPEDPGMNGQKVPQTHRTPHRQSESVLLSSRSRIC
jgi:hypothetical protein